MYMHKILYKEVGWVYRDPETLYREIKNDLKFPDFEVFDEVYTPVKPKPLSQRLIYSHVKDGETLLGVIRLSIESRFSIPNTFAGSGQLRPYSVSIYASPWK